ncbi:hypothetical protein VCHC69A1_0989B, partial [Vibrio cholerae HC-69A1]
FQAVRVYKLSIYWLELKMQIKKHRPKAVLKI